MYIYFYCHKFTVTTNEEQYDSMCGTATEMWQWPDILRYTKL